MSRRRFIGSRGSNVPYSHQDDDPDAHGLWVLDQIGDYSPPLSCTSSSTSSSDDEDEDEGTPVLLELDPKVSKKGYGQLKYVKKKNGRDNYSNCVPPWPSSRSDSDSGSISDGYDSSASSVYSSGSRCGNDCDSNCDSNCEDCTRMRVYIPVSCSKKCKHCFGRSPGCGRNYGFKNIGRRGLILCQETCDNIKEMSSNAKPFPHEYLTLNITIPS